MGTSKENEEQELRRSWESADNTPGGYCRVDGVVGSVTQGEVFRAITEGKQSIIEGPKKGVKSVGRRKRKGGGFHQSDASWGMRGIRRPGVGR